VFTVLVLDPRVRVDQLLLVEITPTHRLFLLIPRTKEVHVPRIETAAFV
jgi:hypothetical protein